MKREPHCNHRSWRIELAGALLALVVAVAGPPPVLGDEMGDALKETQQATKEANDASAEAEKINPVGDVRNAEDAADKAARNNDDIQDSSAPQAAKDAAKMAADDARANADAVRTKAEDEKRDQGSGQKYRDAIEKRRAARNKLKKARAKLQPFIQKNRQGGMGKEAMEVYERAWGESGSALGRAERPSTYAVGPRTATGLGGDGSYAALVADHAIAVTITGTGETIGHIANLQIQNLTPAAVTFVVPPMVLESGSGKNQHYACPRPQSVAIAPNSTKTVPVNGVCLVRNKPPVADGVGGDLQVNAGKPTDVKNPAAQFSPRDASRLLRLVAAKYDSADKLQKQGALKALPYKDPEKQKDIVVQWSTWSDPRISDLTGSPPATKEDLKKTVYKQTAQNGPITPEVKKKLDTGIDTIFSKIELTSKKAKDLEEPDPFKGVALTGDGGKAGGPVNVSDDAGKTGDLPKTTEKQDGTPVVTVSEGPRGQTTTTTVATSPDGTTTTTREDKDAAGMTTSKTITTAKTVDHGDGTHTTTKETTDEKGSEKVVITRDKNDVPTETHMTKTDKHGRTTEEYHSKDKGGFTTHTTEYYPDKDGAPGTLKSDRTEAHGDDGKLISGSETTINENGQTSTRNLP